MFAIIEFRGKQVKVVPGKEYKLPYFQCKVGEKFIPDRILLVSDDKRLIMDEKELANAKIEGKVIEIGQDKKISVVKFHAKKRYQKLAGHRQDFVKANIEKISV